MRVRVSLEKTKEERNPLFKKLSNNDVCISEHSMSSELIKEEDNMYISSNGNIIKRNKSSSNSSYDISSYSDNSNEDESQINKIIPETQFIHQYYNIFKCCHNIKNYKDYHLKKRDSHKREISNLYLPLNKKNNESYKLNLINYLRVPQISENKSVNCKFSEYRMMNKTGCSYIPKIKKITSERKIYSSEQPMYCYKLIDGKLKNTVPLFFRFYYDNDIGFNYNWQKELILSEQDDDIESDNELLAQAQEKTEEDLISGIESFKKNKKLCRNYHRFK